MAALLLGETPGKYDTDHLKCSSHYDPATCGGKALGWCLPFLLYLFVSIYVCVNKLQKWSSHQLGHIWWKRINNWHGLLKIQYTYHLYLIRYLCELYAYLVILSQNSQAIRCTHIKGEIMTRKLSLEEPYQSWKVADSAKQVGILFLFIILFLNLGLFEHIRHADSISWV